MNKAEFLYQVKQLRTNQTDAERKLWGCLRAKRFAGFKFKRQQPIDRYITDFCCLRARLIIEVDGGHHQEQKLYDEERTRYLNEHGFRVLRFWNNEVLHQTDRILEVIHQALRPSPFSGEGGRRPGEGAYRESTVGERGK